MKLSLLFERLLGMQPQLAETHYGMPTIKFDRKAITQAVKDDLRGNIESLADFGPTDFDHLYSIAQKSILMDRDIAALCDAIVAMKVAGVDQERAGHISRFLNNRATAFIEREQQTKLGITHAIWVYSGAPCRLGRDDGNKPQDDAHKQAHGMRYEVAQGMFLDGIWTWPGREAGCKCGSRAVT